MMNISDTNIINEDYCSFETAKLLKEKGFDGKCYHAYSFENGDKKLISAGLVIEGSVVITSEDTNISADYYKKEFGSDIEFYLAPTHQLALKWLREVHKIHINFDIHWLHFANQNGWMYVIERILDNGVDYVDSKGDSSDLTFFSTYEEACEAAILYVLKNLI